MEDFRLEGIAAASDQNNLYMLSKKTTSVTERLLSLVRKFFENLSRSQNANLIYPSLISPKSMIEKRGLDGLCETADAYYRRMPIPNQAMAKPFSDFRDGPHNLIRLGTLLGGMHLGKGMTVLDFGAGTCWLSRYLAQMQCIPIAVDVSAAALKMGEILFRDYPPVGDCIAPPKFLCFDGYKLPLETSSVDRIICFDALHHVPNRPEILQEFYRVLRPGGIAGFSEPVGRHSESPQSQMEMRNFGVLEDDIILEELERDVTKMQFKFFLHDSSGIFFLHKGVYIPDSRCHDELCHEIKIVSGKLRIKNTGGAVWLHEVQYGFGKVQVGAHLFHGESLVNYDFLRIPLPYDLHPGESVEFPVPDTPLDHRLVVDMVAEGVTWFENLHSVPIELRPSG